MLRIVRDPRTSPTDDAEHRPRLEDPLRRTIVYAAVTLALVVLVGTSATAQSLMPMPPARHPGAGQTLYFVLPDRFENGATANDTGGISGGREQHGFDPTAIQYFHGGDFAGLTSRLDYLAELGVTAIWISPPLRNKPVQSGSAGYHGYWILDYLQVDPHLGTDDEFRAFIDETHARGIRVVMDVVVNHTADVIQFQDVNYSYRSRAAAPYRDSAGQVFDERAFAFNGLRDPNDFPALSAQVSFPHVPFAPAAEAQAKNPAWLNDLTLYHNRGNSTFTGEDSVLGDFFGLDDLFTEHPRVVQGMIDIHAHWIAHYDLDGFRIDTVKHVNPELWQAFAPAMRAAARGRGRPDFLHFGEVFSGDSNFLSQWPTAATLDTVLDFAFAFAARDFVSRAQGASRLESLFDADDRFIDHDSDVNAVVTFLGNHDIGRFGYFLRQDNPFASDTQLVDLMELGHGLLFLVRGQPVVYYGDEQGMIGTGGDTGAREDMFATQAATYANLSRIGTTARGTVAKFETTHPLFQTIRALAQLRAAHAALRGGAMLVRPSGNASVFACSHLARDERIEYLAAFNNSRGVAATVSLPTSQPNGAVLRRIFDSRTPGNPGDATLVADATGRVTITLEALQFAVFRAESALPTPGVPPSLALVTPAAGSLLTIGSETVDGQTFPARVLVQASMDGASDFAEVTFALSRADRPGHFELLGVDDTPPYRVYWRPPADLAAGETFSFVAAADNLRGGRGSTEVDGLRFSSTPGVTLGITGSTTPTITSLPGSISTTAGETVLVQATATGTPPLEFQWLKNGAAIPGATSTLLKLRRVTATDASSYALRVRNLASTALSATIVLDVAPRLAPVILAPPASATVAPGGTEVFEVTAVADQPLTYQWTKDGTPIAGANASSLALSGLSVADSGEYAVVVTAGGASTTSASAHLLVATPFPGRLINLSVRTRTASGSDTLIAGFVVSGHDLQVLVRGIGPALAEFGVTGFTADPRLFLFRGSLPIADNDDWLGSAALTAAFARTGAFDLPPASTDAALIVDLAPGEYTAHVSSADAGSGIALVEVYEDTGGSGARLINLSTRAHVGIGDETLIAGFVINGNVPRRVLFRAVGPTLAGFGVAGALADPALAIYRDGQPAAVIANDDWDGAPSLAATFLEVGAFDLPAESLDAAGVVTLVPGVYTAHVSGVGAATGIALVEVYELP